MNDRIKSRQKVGMMMEDDAQGEEKGGIGVIA